MIVSFLILLFCSVHHSSAAALEDGNIDIEDTDAEVEIVETDADVNIRVVEDRKITGKDCEYIKLCEVINNVGCANGDKFVIRKMRGTRRQYLIMNGSPVLGFRQKKMKFSSCSSFTQITSSLKCKEVSGLNAVDLSASTNSSLSAKSMLDIVDGLGDIEVHENVLVEKDEVVERVIRGKNCEFIRICDVTSNSGCSDGNKLVVKKQKGLRRQFLILNGSPVLGFIKRKNKFTSCDTYKDVTDSVDCKGVQGLSGLDLSSSTNTTSSTNSSAVNLF